MSRMLVVAPHLDDACFSVGEAISAWPEVTIITVLCGKPMAGQVTDYDIACGFDDSRVAMGAREIEHGLACNVLGAEWVNLSYLDAQYGSPDGQPEMITDHLGRLLCDEAPAVVLIPLGITHPDHQMVTRCCVAALRNQPDISEVLVYEDLPYRVLDPMAAYESWFALNQSLTVDKRMTDLVPLSDGTSLAKKLEAIQCYRSQLSEDIERCCRVPERIWRLR